MRTEPKLIAEIDLSKYEYSFEVFARLIWQKLFNTYRCRDCNLNSLDSLLKDLKILEKRLEEFFSNTDTSMEALEKDTYLTLYWVYIPETHITRIHDSSPLHLTTHENAVEICLKYRLDTKLGATTRFVTITEIEY